MYQKPILARKQPGRNILIEGNTPPEPLIKPHLGQAPGCTDLHPKCVC